MQIQMLPELMRLRLDAFQEVQKAQALYRALDTAVVAAGGASLSLETSPAVAKLMGTAIPATIGPRMFAGGGAAVPVHLRSHGDYAVAALGEAREPLPIGRLQEAVEKMGAKIGGSDPLANFRTSLSREKRVISIRRNNMYFWWFSDQPLPADWAKGAELDLGEEPAPIVGANQKGDPDAEKT